MNQKTRPKRTIRASFCHGPKPRAQRRRSIARGGDQIDEDPWSSAATSIVLYNRAHHPSSYAFDGGGAGAIRAAGRPRPRGRGGASTSLSSFVVVVDDAPPTSSPPSPTTHHRRHDVTLRLTSGEEHIFRLLVDAAEATMPDR